MSLVKSQRKQTDMAEELEERVARQRIIEEIEAHKMKPGSNHYCKHSARLPVLLVAERTADRPAHVIQGFHCFDCGRDIPEKAEATTFEK
jgi:hypothetical protein